MAEQVEKIQEKLETMPEKLETKPEKIEELKTESEPAPAVVVEPVEPRRSQGCLLPQKRGRPAGAKDRAPRKKKVDIIEEPIAEPIVEPIVEPVPKKAKKASLPRLDADFEKNEIVLPPPPSPRTVLREASRHILELKRLESSSRRANLYEMYSRNLHRL